ncbi:DUF4251 domain-containing protein [Bacteroides sp. 224]|uniref:DUF4251 domain-containing protein n=1 Tax=Bacteroides sp. 224 TaxID=2302936 RepID=UPI0013D56620|nr:DUF4251 domain-containing protein [Bacteroides sp. 224]NDV66720.1 DUF4251 domain-containing protein [Bacteroides sp. 224]
MKLNKRTLLLGIFAFVGICTISAQTKKEKEEQQKQQLKEIINSGDYTIDVNMAHPQSGKTINLTSRYSVKVKNDSVFSYLPYFGRAYSIPIGSGSGSALIFDSPIKEYKVEYIKKGAARIKFSAQTSEDTYNFILTVHPNGSSSVAVNMNKRQSIDFMGELNREEEE